MQLTGQQIDQYHEEGYFLLEGCFSPPEVSLLKDEQRRLMSEEEIGKAAGLEIVWAPHKKSRLFDALVRHPRLVSPSVELLGSDVYVLRCKLHSKPAFTEESVHWHQDYKRWHNTDGLPSPRVTSMAVFLDEITEFNGGLILIPGSHKEGLLAAPSRADVFGAAFETRRYDVDTGTLAKLIERYGLVLPKGPAGSVLIFEANLVHASGPNMTPLAREMVLLAHNSVDNALLQVPYPREEIRASRDPTPIRPVPDDALLAYATTAPG